MTSKGEPPSDDREESGYRRPPKQTRFTKGRSGNPAGRPRGRHRQAPYEAVLGQMVRIREGGAERRVTAAEAFLLQLAKRGIEGDSAASRAALAVLEEAQKKRKRKRCCDRHREPSSVRRRHASAEAAAHGEDT